MQIADVFVASGLTAAGYEYSLFLCYVVLIDAFVFCLVNVDENTLIC
jgi:hypothetical protein